MREVKSLATPARALGEPSAWRPCTWPVFESGVVALLVAASVAAQVSARALAVLQFDRAAIAAGQVWRVVTGNFVHYGWGHLAANLGAFAALCWIARGRGRGVLGVTVLGSLAVGAAVYVWGRGVGVYRGISGVDCALLAWVLVAMAQQDRGWRRWVWVGVLMVVAAKAIYEQGSGVLLLPTSAPAGVQVVGVTHLVGLALGAGMAIAPRRGGRAKDEIKMTNNPG